MYGDGANASSVFGVEGLLVFGEVVVDGVGDACCVEYGVAIENECVVAFEAVVAVEAVQFDHCLRDGTVGVYLLLMPIVVVEIFCYLGEEELL